MSERFYCGPIQANPGAVVVLSGSEAHHLLHVMRAKPGDRVVLFDGQGREYRVELLSGKKAEAQLRVIQVEEVSRELPGRLILACALPKGERQRWLVEKAVELGVSQFVPLLTDRSVARPTAEALDRLRRAVIEASKQCGRNLLMDITTPDRWSSFCQRSDLPSVRLLAHPLEISEQSGEVPWPGEDPSAAPAGPAEASSVWERVRPYREVVIAVGPEGGFTPAEVALAVARGWELVQLGSRILRTETAAVMLSSLVAARLIGLL
jgi:16S rRNA (uracil1498-N3)-methyltransferase